MKSIKKLTFISLTVLFLLSYSGSINGVSAIDLGKDATTEDVAMKETYYSPEIIACGGLDTESNEALRDCTIRVRGEGYDLKVTFHDVSRWTCLKIKIGNFFR